MDMRKVFLCLLALSCVGLSACHKFQSLQTNFKTTVSTTSQTQKASSSSTFTSTSISESSTQTELSSSSTQSITTETESFDNQTTPSSSQDEASVSQPTGIQLEELAVGNYASLAGTWTTGDGSDTIIIQPDGYSYNANSGVGFVSLVGGLQSVNGYPYIYCQFEDDSVMRINVLVLLEAGRASGSSDASRDRLYFTSNRSNGYEFADDSLCYYKVAD